MLPFTTSSVAICDIKYIHVTWALESIHCDSHIHENIIIS